MRAVLALSGDPITNGHLDVINRASAIFRASSNFDELIVAIGVNPDKKYTFDLQERRDLTRNAIPNFSIKVTSFTGLLIDFAKLNNVDVIIRSIRNATDYNYEQMLNDINRSQEFGIETITLFAKQNLTHISSSAVKELQKHHGDISNYVPVNVKDALERKISNQVLIGITGGIACGKSFVTKTIMQFITNRILKITDQKLDVHNIDLDQIGREILTKAKDPYYVEVRRKLASAFKDDIINHESNVAHCIDLSKLTSLMFTSKEDVNIFNTIMKEPTIFAFRQLLNNLTGLIFVNSALLAESQLAHLTNNNIICVFADDDIRLKRLQQRKYSDEKIKQILNIQMKQEAKIQYLKEQARLSSYGHIEVFDNSNASTADIENFFFNIIQYYNLSKFSTIKPFNI